MKLTIPAIFRISCAVVFSVASAWAADRNTTAKRRPALTIDNLAAAPAAAASGKTLPGQAEINEILVGTWRVTWPDNGWNAPRIFMADGALMASGSGKIAPVLGHWKIEGDSMTLTFGDGGSERWVLPVDPKGTTAFGKRNRKMTAVKESSSTTVPTEPTPAPAASAPAASAPAAPAPAAPAPAAPPPPPPSAERASIPPPQMASIKPPPALSPSDLVKVHRSNLVFVTTPDGAGSGFVASYGTGTFLITNAHVAAMAKGAMFKTLEGTQLQVGAPAVAVEHDIFLMAVTAEGTALQVMTGVDENVTIGDEVVVLGNAEGAGVINTIKGKVVGLGPNLVEIDAPFQPGNSGSPIIHLKTGKVIGVATYHTIRKFDSATKQAVKDPIVRRFGYRLDSVKTWQPVNWQTFHAQAAEIDAIHKLSNDLVAFLRDLGMNGHVTRGAHTNPLIKNRIDQWLDARGKRLSPRDAAMADQSLLSFLKITCQTDVAAAQPRMTYDYFQRQLADQQRERTEMAGVFGKIIENVK